MRVVDVGLKMNTGSMARLTRVEKIVVHTEGEVIFKRVVGGDPVRVNSPKGVDPKDLIFHADVDAAELNHWAMKGLGWSGVGYHMVSLNARHSKYPDGTLMVGRPLQYQGAHVAGLNDRSLGICAVGNGDFEDFTQAQKLAIAEQCAIWVRQFGLDVKDVLGHRETPPFVPGTRQDTSKTCPGTQVDMNEIRMMIEGFLDSPPSSDHEKAVAKELAEARWAARANMPVDQVTDAASTLLYLLDRIGEDGPELAGRLRNVLVELKNFYK